MTKTNTRLQVGDRLPVHTMTDMFGAEIPLAPVEGWTHVQFLRFAGCPICNLHLRSFITQRDQIASAGIREVLVFHSSVDEMKTYQDDLPFTTIADPDKNLYATFGVERSARALANPKAWGPAIRGAITDIREARRSDAPMPPRTPSNGVLGLPADFLISDLGLVRAAHYGKHAGDQWSVEQLLVHVQAATK